MALTTTRVYRWDDAFAPVMNNQPGSFYNIIKQIVAGYGTREPCGWTLVYDDPENYTLAIRNSMEHGGSGCYLRVVDDGGFTGGGRVASVQCYEDMTDVNTGTAPTTVRYVWKSGPDNSDPKAWVIVSDERTMYIGTHVSDDVPAPPLTGAMMGGWGDYDAYIPGDPGVFCAGMSDQNPGTGNTNVVCDLGFSVQANLNAVNNAVVQATLTRDNDLSPAATRFSLIPMGGAYNSSNSNSPFAGGSAPHGTSVAIPEYYYPLFLAADGRLRGKLRGLYSCMSYVTEKYFTGDSILTNERKLLAIKGGLANSNNAVYFFVMFAETDSSWDTA